MLCGGQRQRQFRSSQSKWFIILYYVSETRYCFKNADPKKYFIHSGDLQVAGFVPAAGFTKFCLQRQRQFLASYVCNGLQSFAWTCVAQYRQQLKRLDNKSSIHCLTLHWHLHLLCFSMLTCFTFKREPFESIATTFFFIIVTPSRVGTQWSDSCLQQPPQRSTKAQAGR